MENKINKYLPLLLHSKDAIGYIIISVILILGIILTTSSLLLSYQTASSTEAQVMSMESYLKDWTEKTAVLNQSQMRPVKETQVDDVQTNILINLQVYRLNLTKFNTLANNKNEKNRSFELEFEGSYEATIQFLQNFHAKDALLSITNLTMEPVKQNIKTTMQYKVYVK